MGRAGIYTSNFAGFGGFTMRILRVSIDIRSRFCVIPDAFGMALENAVAQELRAHGRPGLYYSSNVNVSGADFLIEDKHSGEVIPIEVKSGRYSTKHATLDALTAVKNYGIRRAVVLHTRNVSRSQDSRVTYLPIYMAGLLQGRKLLRRCSRGRWNREAEDSSRMRARAAHCGW
jgi:predicted AAA+ superfamily ATPase